MIIERNTLEQWLSMFGYEVEIKTPFNIAKSNLDIKAKRLLSVLTYPKILITESDIMYLRNFWSKKSSEMAFLYKICESILVSDYGVVPIVGHNLYSNSIIYLTSNNGEQLSIKALIIPEEIVSNTVEMNKLARNYSDLLNVINYPIKFNLEDDREQKTPLILLIEEDNWISYYKTIFEEGYYVGDIHIGIDAVIIKIKDRLIISGANPHLNGEQEIIESTIGDVGLLVKLVSINSYKKDIKNSLSNIRREYINQKSIL